MAFVHGSDSGIVVDGTTISAYVDSVSHNRSVDTAETSAFTNNDKTFIAGLEDGSFDLSGHWDTAADTALDGCFDSASVSLIYGPAGVTSGLVKYTATCFVTSYQIVSNVGDRTNWTGSFQRSGDLTKGTF
jgi:hypothetical protein